MRFLAINLNHPAHYFTFGSFSISAGNLLIILFMILIFLLALVLPFPGHEGQTAHSKSDSRENERGKR